jgi:hypothetical protein
MYALILAVVCGAVVFGAGCVAGYVVGRQAVPVAQAEESTQDLGGVVLDYAAYTTPDETESLDRSEKRADLRADPGFFERG